MKTDATGRAAERKGYVIARLDEIEPVPCPCGMSRRAFVDPSNTVATLHVVDISEDARAHYHERLTEIYYVLEGEGHIELDGEMVPVRPGSAVLIFPGTRHRAVGKLKVLNVPVPAFDAADEHFD
jgi:mannose-6-phosphate isomerase-like protein (cupin superfamily)